MAKRFAASANFDKNIMLSVFITGTGLVKEALGISA